MTDQTKPVEPARVLAALKVLGWPDDREASAHVEPDGYHVTPAGMYWELASDIIRAAEPLGPVELAARLFACVDQALAITQTALMAAGSNRQLADWALDVRLALQPPNRT